MSAFHAGNFVRRAPVLAQAALRRFPVVMLAGLAVTIVMMSEPEDATGQRFLLAAILAVSTALAASLLVERRGVSPMNAWPIVLGITAAVIAAFVLTAEIITWTPPWASGGAAHRKLSEAVLYRFAGLLLAAHAAVAVAPWIGRGAVAEFWQFNRRLLLRALATALFAGALFAGLALALWSIDELLTIDVDDETYRDLFAILLGVFTTWFFTAGVPRTTAHGDVVPAMDATPGPTSATVVESTDGAFAGAGEDVSSYPRSLKAFAGFVLIPLTVVYLVILYLYLGRILIEWNLPDGRVAMLVFGYSVVGILAYLLIYPLRTESDNQWIRAFARWFFLAMPPLLVLLVVAMLRRTSEYGLTEQRVFGLLLAVWLAGITVWFLMRREDIRVIPASLAVLAVLAVVGPWSATSISVRSQLSALERWVATPADTSASAREAYNERAGAIHSIAWYLGERGALADAAAIVSKQPETLTTVDDVVAAAGARQDWGTNDTAATRPLRTSLFIAARGASVDVTGFTRMTPMADFVNFQADGLRVRWLDLRRAVEVVGATGRTQLNVGAAVDSLRRVRLDAEYHRGSPLVIDGRAGDRRVRLIVTKLGFRPDGIETVEAVLLY